MPGHVLTADGGLSHAKAAAGTAQQWRDRACSWSCCFLQLLLTIPWKLWAGGVEQTSGPDWPWLASPAMALSMLSTGLLLLWLLSDIMGLCIHGNATPPSQPPLVLLVALVMGAAATPLWEPLGNATLQPSVALPFVYAACICIVQELPGRRVVWSLLLSAVHAVYLFQLATRLEPVASLSDVESGVWAGPAMCPATFNASAPLNLVCTAAEQLLAPNATMAAAAAAAAAEAGSHVSMPRAAVTADEHADRLIWGILGLAATLAAPLLSPLLAGLLAPNEPATSSRHRRSATRSQQADSSTLLATHSGSLQDVLLGEGVTELLSSVTGTSGGWEEAASKQDGGLSSSAGMGSQGEGSRMQAEGQGTSRMARTNSGGAVGSAGRAAGAGKASDGSGGDVPEARKLHRVSSQGLSTRTKLFCHLLDALSWLVISLTLTSHHLTTHVELSDAWPETARNGTWSEAGTASQEPTRPLRPVLLMTCLLMACSCVSLLLLEAAITLRLSHTMEGTRHGAMWCGSPAMLMSLAGKAGLLLILLRVHDGFGQPSGLNHHNRLSYFSGGPHGPHMALCAGLASSVFSMGAAADATGWWLAQMIAVPALLLCAFVPARRPLYAHQQQRQMLEQATGLAALAMVPLSAVCATWCRGPQAPQGDEMEAAAEEATRSVDGVSSEKESGLQETAATGSHVRQRPLPPAALQPAQSAPVLPAGRQQRPQPALEGVWSAGAAPGATPTHHTTHTMQPVIAKQDSLQNAMAGWDRQQAQWQVEELARRTSMAEQDRQEWLPAQAQTYTMPSPMDSMPDAAQHYSVPEDEEWLPDSVRPYSVPEDREWSPVLAQIPPPSGSAPDLPPPQQYLASFEQGYSAPLPEFGGQGPWYIQGMSNNNTAAPAINQGLPPGLHIAQPSWQALPRSNSSGRPVAGQAPPRSRPKRSYSVAELQSAPRPAYPASFQTSQSTVGDATAGPPATFTNGSYGMARDSGSSRRKSWLRHAQSAGLGDGRDQRAVLGGRGGQVVLPPRHVKAGLTAEMQALLKGADAYDQLLERASRHSSGHRTSPIDTDLTRPSNNIWDHLTPSASSYNRDSPPLHVPYADRQPSHISAPLPHLQDPFSRSKPPNELRSRQSASPAHHPYVPRPMPGFRHAPMQQVQSRFSSAQHFPSHASHQPQTGAGWNSNGNRSTPKMAYNPDNDNIGSSSNLVRQHSRDSFGRQPSRDSFGRQSSRDSFGRQPSAFDPPDAVLDSSPPQDLHNVSPSASTPPPKPPRAPSASQLFPTAGSNSPGLTSPTGSAKPLQARYRLAPEPELPSVPNRAMGRSPPPRDMPPAALTPPRSTRDVSEAVTSPPPTTPSAPPARLSSLTRLPSTGSSGGSSNWDWFAPVVQPLADGQSGPVPRVSSQDKSTATEQATRIPPQSARGSSSHQPEQASEKPIPRRATAAPNLAGWDPPPIPSLFNVTKQAAGHGAGPSSDAAPAAAKPTAAPQFIKRGPYSSRAQRDNDSGTGAGNNGSSSAMNQSYSLPVPHMVAATATLPLAPSGNAGLPQPQQSAGANGSSSRRSSNASHSRNNGRRSRGSWEPFANFGRSSMATSVSSGGGSRNASALASIPEGAALLPNHDGPPRVWTMPANAATGLMPPSRSGHHRLPPAASAPVDPAFGDAGVMGPGLSRAFSVPVSGSVSVPTTSPPPAILGLAGKSSTPPPPAFTGASGWAAPPTGQPGVPHVSPQPLGSGAAPWIVSPGTPWMAAPSGFSPDSQNAAAASNMWRSSPGQGPAPWSSDACEPWSPASNGLVSAATAAKTGGQEEMCGISMLSTPISMISDVVPGVEQAPLSDHSGWAELSSGVPGHSEISPASQPSAVTAAEPNVRKPSTQRSPTAPPQASEGTGAGPVKPPSAAARPAKLFSALAELDQLRRAGS